MEVAELYATAIPSKVESRKINNFYTSLLLMSLLIGNCFGKVDSPSKTSIDEKAEQIVEYYVDFTKGPLELQVAYDWKETSPFLVDPFSPPERFPEGMSHVSFQVVVAIGRDRLAYNGFKRRLLSSINPRPSLEPFKMVVSGARSSQLFYEDGVAKQLTISCGNVQLPGVSEYLIFAELFDCLPVPGAENSRSLAHALALCTPIGWVVNGETEEFVLREQLPSTTASRVREWHFSAQGSPHLLSKITYSSPVVGTERAEHIDKFVYTWGEIKGQWLPVRIERSVSQKGEVVSIEQTLSLVSLEATPKLDDSLFTLVAPDGVMIVDECNPENHSPENRFSSYSVMLLLVFGVIIFAVIGLWSRRLRSSSKA